MKQKTLTLGNFEELILLAILSLNHNAYGAGICRRVEFATGNKVSAGALYSTLRRLEAKGYITQVSKSKKRIYFHVTGSGCVAVDKHWAAVRALRDGV